VVPASFDGADIVFDRPSNMSRDECEAISGKIVLVGKAEIPAIVTCWKLTTEEIAHLVKGGRLWILTTGDKLWPIRPTTEKPF
jgi:hypothetical protein